MRSTIDWNEIVPKLKKELQDTLYLEAVVLLSGSAPRSREPQGRIRKRRAPHETNLQRQWRVKGDGEYLSKQGRHYRINKTKRDHPRAGNIGAIWAKLLDCKNDVIAYEGIASICKGQGVGVATIIGQLWERGLIDVTVPENKVAVAY